MISEGLFDLFFQFLYRTVIYIVVEVFAHSFFYFSGFAVIKLFTLTKYPQMQRKEAIEAKKVSHIIGVGVFFWLLVFLAVIAVNWN